MRLYVTGQSPKSALARANLKRICEQYLCDKYELEVIDVLEEPLRLIRDSIPTTPALVRVKPPPVRRILGDLSNLTQVLIALEISTSIGTDTT